MKQRVDLDFGDRAWRVARVLAAVVAVAFCGGWAATSASGQDVPPTGGEWVLDPVLWTADATTVGIHLRPHGFRPVGESGGLRAMPVRGPVFGLPPLEALATFQDDRLAQLGVVLYSRGDAGDLAEPEFFARKADLATRLSQWVGGPGFPQKPLASGGTTQEIHVWTKGSLRLDLEWAYTRNARAPDGSVIKFRAEYIRLRCRRYDAAQQARLVGGSAQTAGPATRKPFLTLYDLRARVKTLPDGAHLVSGVPMVDQGPKGYCVAATVERVLRFFERDFDQHKMAQMADTSAAGGTSIEGMLQALRRMSTALDIRVVELYGAESGTEAYDDPAARRRLLVPKSLARTIKEYNRVAKHARQPEIADLTVARSASVDDIYNLMDRAILKEARNSRTIDRDNFFRQVQRHVDLGIPLAWSLMVGLTPEEAETVGIRGVAGHMRMIIGYHPTTRDILYSDSWGPGHEQKRMKLEDAWVGTTGLFAIVPREFRY
ncbi:MAG TPA: C39 family peptidase [Kiritimatiellia bacterium]|nr:C39 family peptidase [Kiritimatiellia bacterium]